MEEARLQVSLPEEMEMKFKKYIYEITIESIERARDDAKIDKEWLRKGEMAKWLGVSASTLNRWEKQGLPICLIDGTQLLSKKDVSKWVLTHQV